MNSILVARTRSSQVKYIYIEPLHQTKQLQSNQSKHINNVRFLMEKHPRLVELIKGFTHWLIWIYPSCLTRLSMKSSLPIQLLLSNYFLRFF